MSGITKCDGLKFISYSGIYRYVFNQNKKAQCLDRKNYSKYNTSTNPFFFKPDILPVKDLFDNNARKFYYKYLHESSTSPFLFFHALHIISSGGTGELWLSFVSYCTKSDSEITGVHSNHLIWKTHRIDC